MDLRQRIAAAFDGVERPPDDALLHPQCRDDGDLQVLYGVRDWRELTGEQVVAEYAALAFLSPAGFRHFLPAYLLWVLRHPDSGEAVVDSTVWAFHVEMYDEGLRPFVASKPSLLDDGQWAVVLDWLAAMAAAGHPDAAAAAAYWRSQRGR